MNAAGPPRRSGPPRRCRKHRTRRGVRCVHGPDVGRGASCVRWSPAVRHASVATSKRAMPADTSASLTTAAAIATVQSCPGPGKRDRLAAQALCAQARRSSPIREERRLTQWITVRATGRRREAVLPSDQLHEGRSYWWISGVCSDTDLVRTGRNAEERSVLRPQGSATQRTEARRRLRMNASHANCRAVRHVFDEQHPSGFWRQLRNIDLEHRSIPCTRHQDGHLLVFRSVVPTEEPSITSAIGTRTTLLAGSWPIGSSTDASTVRGSKNAEISLRTLEWGRSRVTSRPSMASYPAR